MVEIEIDAELIPEFFIDKLLESYLLLLDEYINEGDL